MQVGRRGDWGGVELRWQEGGAVGLVVETEVG